MKGRIVYVYNLHVSFILKDIAILEGPFQVLRYFFDTSSGLRLVWGFVMQIFRLPFLIRSSDLVVVFFAGYHSLFPVLLAKVLRKPCLLMLGGADCYNFPSIDYGNYRKPLMRMFTALSIRHATHLSSVHEALVESEYHYDDHDFDRQGYKAFVKNVKAPETTIYLEYDPRLFQFRQSAPAPRSFITVGFGMDGNTFKRKGVDLIVEAATVLKDCTFTIVGSDNPALHASLPSNIRLLAPVPYEHLPALYQNHQFYLQLSMAEGFPSAICEAMLCGCIPIGSNVAAIPFIIGDTGFILKRKDVTLMIDLCRQALQSDTDLLSRKARQRILDVCAPGTRASSLVALVNSLVAPHSHDLEG